MKFFNLKKISSTVFFCILFSVFLNTLSFAEDSSQKDFIPPLVISDFNNGTLINNLGGLTGGDEQKPGTAFAIIVSDNGFRRGESGSALRVDYDVSKSGEYSFYWMKLGKELPGRSDITTTLSLSDYSYLSFWVKATPDIRKLKVELHQDLDDNGIFTFGKDITSYVYTDSYINGGKITNEWKKVVIPLRDFALIKDWSKMIEVVIVFENRTVQQTGAFYVDDMLFGYRSELTLISKGTKEIRPPVESSFKVNGVDSRQCLTLTGFNTLKIDAESVYDNPFIESVRFEYSFDKGGTWRTIGVDYDVAKKAYQAAWQPDNSRELLRYQVRAVATDIWGNEKATAVLIDCGVKPITDDEFLNLVERKSFDFFYDHQNQKTGLFSDTTGGGDASIASTGFGLAALCVGAERGWIEKEDARKRVLLALDAFLQKADGAEPLAEGRYGFFYHFLNIHTGNRAPKSEISTVDTAILVCGALTAGEYFGGEAKKKSEELYRQVEWEKFLSKEKGPLYNLFSMGWSPERGFLDSYWDYYTDEVILITLLAIGSPTHPVDPDVFYAWARQKAAYGKGKPLIYSWHGALFSYQYANIWFNFQNMVDKQGINWFENSTNATLANRQFCIDNADKFKNFGPNCWGITSMSRPEGYTMHFGAPPTGNGEPQYDGTISPTGPAGSIVFTPFLSLATLKYMYIKYPKLWGQYGLRDSFNADTNWYAPAYYGIGEAMFLLPIENFRTGFVWKNFMKNTYVKEALKKAGFTKVQKRR